MLFAKNLSRFDRLGRKALRVIKYKGTGRTETEREWRDPPSQKGYALAFEPAVAFINSQLPQNEPIGQAFRKEVRMYPETAIRELVANALIHQDFSVTGAGPMVEIFADRMEITNPGEPLVDTLRFIDTPPKSRNEALAAMMRRMKICEEGGTGIDKVVAAVEAFQLPAPDFTAITTIAGVHQGDVVRPPQAQRDGLHRSGFERVISMPAYVSCSGTADDQRLAAEAIRDRGPQRGQGVPDHCRSC